MIYLNKLTFNVFISFMLILCATEQIWYFNIEHPHVIFFNKNYLSSLNVSARRNSRCDPIHYYNVNFTSKIGFGNNFTIHLYFYEFLSNRYQPSFVEMHVRGCDFVHKDTIFGPVLRTQKALSGHCPYSPGKYVLRNMVIPSAAIPRGFPFYKGRIYTNITEQYNGTLVTAAHVDFELKQKHAVDNCKE